MLNPTTYLLPFLSLLFGGSFFTFVLSIIKITGSNRMRREKSARVYEVAFRLVESQFRLAYQYGAAAASAFHDSRNGGQGGEMLGAFLVIQRDFYGTINEDGQFVMKEFPDFLAMAAKQVALTGEGDILQENEKAPAEKKSGD